MSKAKATIDKAWYQLSAACEHDHDLTRILTEAYDAAYQGERRHHRAAPDGAARYPHSAATYARWFVVRWFALHDSKPTTWGEATRTRADVRLAQGLRERMDEAKRNPWTTAPDCASWEYPNLV